MVRIFVCVTLYNYNFNRKYVTQCYICEFGKETAKLTVDSIRTLYICACMLYVCTTV
jgi:hypothetical protein